MYTFAFSRNAIIWKRCACKHLSGSVNCQLRAAFLGRVLAVLRKYVLENKKPAPKSRKLPKSLFRRKTNIKIGFLAKLEYPNFNFHHTIMRNGGNSKGGKSKKTRSQTQGSKQRSSLQNRPLLNQNGAARALRARARRHMFLFS